MLFSLVVLAVASPPFNSEWFRSDAEKIQLDVVCTVWSQSRMLKYTHLNTCSDTPSQQHASYSTASCGVLNARAVYFSSCAGTPGCPDRCALLQIMITPFAF